MGSSSIYTGHIQGISGMYAFDSWGMKTMNIAWSQPTAVNEIYNSSIIQLSVQNFSPLLTVFSNPSNWRYYNVIGFYVYPKL